MRFFSRVLVGAALATAAVAWSSGALAGGMDPTPERLVLQPPGLPVGQTCQSIAFNPNAAIAAGRLPNEFPCRPDTAAFRSLMAELGFAIAPTAFHPAARTTGIGGFTLSLEAAYTRINTAGTSVASDGTETKYWVQGTQGSVDAATKRFSTRNNEPDSALQLYSLKIRKGLPLGFEITGSLGFLANSSLWVTGADLRWAVLEGFRTGALGAIPDISVGGGVRTVTGSSKFYLTAVGIDAQLSKPIPLADMAVLTPRIGYQRLIVFGDSTVSDLTPNTDALDQCGYDGPDPSTGAPVCRNKLNTPQGVIDNNADFNNNATLGRVRSHRNRGLIGVTYRYEIIHLATQFLVDLTSPDSENPGLSDSRQWTFSLEGGVSF